MNFYFLSVALVLAHPGGTDSAGGHTDSSTGIYHYHTTGSSSGSSSSGSSSSGSSSKTSSSSGSSCSTLPPIETFLPMLLSLVAIRTRNK